MANPNIILIVVDQWRGDCLSVDRHPVVHTPYLDQLALDGVRFSRAYSATPSCIAARAALLTGLSPRTHGRLGYRDGVPWDYPVTLAGEFTRHGYQTQAIGKMHVYPERSQMGFQNVILHDGFLHFARGQEGYIERNDDYIPWLRNQTGRADADYFEHGLNCNAQTARPWDKEEYLHPTNWVVSQGLDFLRRRDRRKPFFLNLSFHRPHPPYDPPAWAFEQYINADMPPVPVGDWTNMDLFASAARPFNPDLSVGKMDERWLRRARAGYYGHMTHIDHQVNRFLESLVEHGVEPQTTWVCFTSDHGELLGDHNLFRKSLPYEGSARVPLVLTGPRGSGLRTGASCGSAVELRDIMPTLLEAAGLPVPDCVEGRSLLGIARGQADSVRPYVHGEHTYGGTSAHYLTDGRHKYVWFSRQGQEQLFDLASDPQELCDLSGRAEHAGDVAMWRQRLASELAGREEGFSDGQNLIAGRTITSVLSHILR